MKTSHLTGFTFAFLMTIAAATTQSGCTCIIDPCPELVRRDYSWSVPSRVARLNLSDVSRLSLNSNENILLVVDGGDEFSFSDVESAGQGDNLPTGGRVLAAFRDNIELDLSVSRASSLYIVRVAPRLSALELEAVAEWDIANCNDHFISDPYISRRDPLCGDGMIESPEVCDDENDNADDGCAGCAISPGGCSEDGGLWTFWTCEGEPSECRLIDCAEDSSEPECQELVQLELDMMVDGLIRGTDALPRINSLPEGLDCYCDETALTYSCSESCGAELSPCSLLQTEGTAALEFEGWADGCDGSEDCRVVSELGPVVARYSSPVSGLDGERELVAYPSEEATLELDAMAAGGGVIAAIGQLLGEIDEPSAPSPEPDEEAQPVVVVVDDQLETVGERRFSAAGLREGEEGDIVLLDVAVDDGGDVLLAVALFGTLELEEGAVTADDGEHAGTRPKQLVLVRMNQSLEHLWSTAIPLVQDYDALTARVALTGDGVAGFVLLADYQFYAADEVRDLVTGAVDSEGAVLWTAPLRFETDRSPLIQIDDATDVAVGPEAQVVVAGSVTGEGLFQYELPLDINADGRTLFAVAFDSAGEFQWSTALPGDELGRVRLDGDSDGRTLLLTRSHFASLTAAGELDWSHPITPRPFFVHPDIVEAHRSAAVDQSTGEWVVISEVSTATRSTESSDHFIATLLSRYSPEGDHLWTIRRDSVSDDGLFRLRDLVVSEDLMITMGARYGAGAEESNRALFQRFVQTW